MGSRGAVRPTSAAKKVLHAAELGQALGSLGIACMLIKKEILELIKSGDVTLVFRRWRKPTVKSRGTLRTAIGELFIRRAARK